MNKIKVEPFREDLGRASQPSVSRVALRVLFFFLTLAFGSFSLAACGHSPNHDTPPVSTLAVADVVSVTVQGEPGRYSFSVGIKSPDRGCQQFADWWEVVSLEEELLYRRVLLHSHIEEQPFVRLGAPVPIQGDRIVWIRAHMSSGGYGGAAFRGSVELGFQPAELEESFAENLSRQEPLPKGCAN